MHDPEGWDTVTRMAVARHLALDFCEEVDGFLQWLQWERPQWWYATVNELPLDYISDAESDYLTRGAV